MNCSRDLSLVIHNKSNLCKNRNMKNIKSNNLNNRFFKLNNNINKLKQKIFYWNKKFKN